MSRNLAQTVCYFCDGAVRLEEEGRPITKAEAGPYYETTGGYGFAGMVVANATCVDCEASYLAWIDQSRCDGYGAHPQTDRQGLGFYDLSFRQTFNDEPGPLDMPKWLIVRGIVSKTEIPPCGRCGGRCWPNGECADYRCGR